MNQYSTALTRITTPSGVRVWLRGVVNANEVNIHTFK